MSYTLLNQSDLNNGTLFQITNTGGNQCVSPGNLLPDSNISLVMTNCSNDKKQIFKFDPTTNQIVNTYNNYCFNVDGAATTDNTNVVLYPCGTAPNVPRNNIYNVNADSTQGTTIGTFAAKCDDGTSGTLVQNTCTYGNPSQLFQYQSIVPSYQSIDKTMIDGNIKMVNQMASGKVLTSTPSVDENQRIIDIEKENQLKLMNDRNNLVSMTQNSTNELLGTYNKMFPTLNKVKGTPTPVDNIINKSQPSLFVNEQQESFTNFITPDRRVREKSYQYSNQGITDLQDRVTTVNGEILDMVELLELKQLRITVLNLIIQFLVFSFIIYIFNVFYIISFNSALILYVINLFYLGYQLYQLYFKPMNYWNDMKTEINKINICKK
jgi:hypothetical protein